MLKWIFEFHTLAGALSAMVTLLKWWNLVRVSLGGAT